MWYRVLVDGAAVGGVDLPPRRLAAGRMAGERDYDTIALRIRVASRVLVANGVYGPPLSARSNLERRRARLALAAAASLHVELELMPGGEPVPTVFVNLIESPVDGDVVVVALFEQDIARAAVSIPAPRGRTATGARGPGW